MTTFVIGSNQLSGELPDLSGWKKVDIKRWLSFKAYGISLSGWTI
jgi:hypothetical protein